MTAVYLSSFDRKPCNIAEKLNTGYKTWEFQLHTFGLGPALLYNVLPEPYWKNYCKLKGPPICYAQWTMERTIGNLRQEIRQPSCPYANLSQEGVQRCQVNTLLSIMPELDGPAKGLPTGAVDLGDGFTLLRKRDRYTFSPVGGAAQAILNYLGDGHPLPHIKHWA
ncbi:hypothetical protein F4604DRAFT_1919969 [Suillus subluteus]|nr:hypothetical protein F4604DRAFT_1919969 [Suillus subluteus]